MGWSLKNNVFKLYHDYFKQNDVNKDSEGKGLFERFNGLLGSEYDDTLGNLLETIVSKNLNPKEADVKFLPYIADQLGLGLSISDDVELQRKLLLYVTKIYAVKGTIECYKVLFNLLGITVEVEEYFTAYSLDSEVLFDDDSRVFDSFCNKCTKYSVSLTGATPITTELSNVMWEIIYFNTPINTTVVQLQYNTVTILPTF
jgi:phage tail-like protein